MLIKILAGILFGLLISTNQIKKILEQRRR